MDTTAPKRRISLRHLLLITGLGLAMLVVAAVAYVVFDPFGGYIGDPFSQEIAGRMASPIMLPVCKAFAALSSSAR